MSGETILITRPRGDEQALSDALHARGFRVIHEPLTGIFLRHDTRHAVQQALLRDPDAVIITSRHAAQALALLTELRDPFLICVGEATAQAAQALGFTRVSPAGGTAQKLVDYIADSYDAGSRFLHLSGAHVRLDLETALSSMRIERIAAYEAQAARQLSDTLIEQLKRRQIDAATFFSPRAAQIFLRLLEAGRDKNSTAHMQAFCLSEAVAQAAGSAWKARHVAAEPTLASVVECVDNALN